MSARMTHDKLRQLLAAYALDAVGADEASTIDLHLRECPRCRADVIAHRETAGALASGHDPAPVALWDSIVATLEAAPPISLTRVSGTTRTRRYSKPTLALVSVAAAVVVLVGVVAMRQGNAIDRIQDALEDRTVLAAALAAHGNPEARRADLLSKDGVVLARAVLVPDGTGYLWSDALAPTRTDRTYQLWAVVGTERISAGVLGAHPDVVPFRFAGDVLGLAITEEVAAGVVASVNQPVASGLIVSA